MADILPDTIFRDFSTDAVPSSGQHKPVKSEIRALLNSIVKRGVSVDQFSGSTAAKLDAFFDYLAANGGVGFVPDMYTGLTAKIQKTLTKPTALVGSTMMGSGFQWESGATGGGGLHLQPANGVFPVLVTDLNFETLGAASGIGLYLDFINHISTTNRGTKTYATGEAGEFRGFVRRCRFAGATGVTTDSWQNALVINAARLFKVDEIAALGLRQGSIPHPDVRNAVSLISRDGISRTITNITINRSTGVVRVYYTGTQLPATLADIPSAYFDEIVGLPYMNGCHFVTESHAYAAGAGDFILQNTDGRGWGDYVSGGIFEGSPQVNTFECGSIRANWWNKVLYAGQSEGVFVEDQTSTGCNWGAHIQEQLSFSALRSYFAGTRYGIEINNAGNGELIAPTCAAYDPGQPLEGVTTVSKASPAVVTYTGDRHPELNGYVSFNVDAGMTQLDGNTYRIKNLNTATRTFDLWASDSSAAIDSTAYGTWDAAEGECIPAMVGIKLTGTAERYVLTGGSMEANGDSKIQPILLDDTQRGMTINDVAFVAGIDAAVTVVNDVQYMQIGDGTRLLAGGPTRMLLNESTTEVSFANRNASVILSDTSTSSSTVGHNPSSLNQLIGGDQPFLMFRPTENFPVFGLRHGYHGRKLTWMNGTDPALATARLAILEHRSASLTDAARRFSFPDRMPRLLLPGDPLPLLYSKDNEWIGYGSSDWTDGLDFFTDGMAAMTDELVSGTGAAFTASAYEAATAGRSPLGIRQLATGTTNAGGAAMGQLTSLVRAGRGAAMFVARVAVEALSTSGEEYLVQVGFMDATAGGADIANGIYWEYNRGDSGNPTVWRTVTAQASTRTKTDTATSVNTGYRYLGVFMNGDWTRADFFSSGNGADWTFAGTSHTANIPSGSQVIGFGARIRKTVGTTSRNLHVDLMGMSYRSIRGS